MDLFSSLVLFGMFATVVALAGGIILMAHGGKLDQHYSGELMAIRVGLQGIVFLLLLVSFVLHLR